ncbi:MAG: ferritin-like domain-containing protein [Gammaproteobacteria bacterium]
MAKDPAREALIKGLNEDLANEYMAIISYLLFSRMVQGPLRPELSKFLEGEIEDELGHAKFLSHKIVALGGTPTTEPAPVTLTEDNREMLQLALQAEKETIERYTQRIKQAEAIGDVGLRVELETIVAEETKHKEELERVLYGWRD